MTKKFLTGLKLVNLPSDPSVGSEGELYFNSSASVAKIYQAGAWSVLGAGAGGGTTVSTTEPASPEIGDSWYKNDTGEFYVYDGTYWVEVNGTISLSQEQVQDYVAPMFTGATNTNVIATYDDANNVINLNTSGSITNIDSISSPDFIQFDTTANVTPVTGLLGWDSVEGTLNLGLSSNKHIHVGEESVYRVRNSTGSTISKGTALYASGVEPSGRIQVTPYVADGSVREVRFMGLATENISNGINGFVQHFGYVRDLDTRGTSSTAISVGDETWAAGDILYVHPTVPGKLTNVKPTHAVVVAIIIIRHQTTGILFVRPSSGGHLEDIHDILISGSVQNNELLAYNSASGFWVNKTADEANLATRDGWEYDSVINIRSYDGITDGAINLEGYLNAIRLSDDNGIILTTNGGSANFTFNNSGQLQFPDASIQNTAFLGMPSYTTSNLSEGSNLYYTDERAQDAIGNNLGSGLLYNDTTGAISNSGALSLSGTTNEISVSASTGNITIGIPDSPVFVTPNIGVATATSINGTTIPSSKTLVVTTDVGSTVQAYDADLTSIAALTGTSGLLTTNGSGTWSVDTNTYSTTAHNHSIDSLSNVQISGLADGDSIVWSSASSKWINQIPEGGASVIISSTAPVSPEEGDMWFDSDTLELFIFDSLYWVEVSGGAVDLSGYLTIASASSSYLTKTSASTTYQPIGSYLTSESDTLSSVTSRGATTSSAISITNSTPASSVSTGALIVSGGVGIGEDLYVNNNVYIGGDINITGSISGSISYINVTDLVVTDPLIYLADSNPNDMVDIGIFGAYNHSSSVQYHTGLIRDASDSGKWKLASNLLDPTSNVIDFTGATFDTLKIGALEVTDTSTTRTNLGLAIGTDVQAYNSTLASVAGGTYTGDDSITTVGTISSGTWNGTTIGYTKGGTGLTTLGTAGQVLAVNASANAIQWITPSAGGGSSAAAVTSNPPASPELNQVWQDLDTGRIYVWNGTFWIEVQQNGSLGLLRYLGAASSAPVTSIDGSALQTGEVYFDTVFNGMKVYDGTAWEDAFSAASLSVGRWVKTAVGGETSLSGNDDSSLTLVYTPGIEEVYLNGVKLIRGSDYIGTSGSVISNLEPLTANSVVEVISYSGFTVANTYTKTEVDNLIQKKGVRWIEVVGVGASVTTLTGLDDYSNTLSYTPGTEQVFINGILVTRGLDYTATDGSSVVLVTPVLDGDVVEISGTSTFSVANTYTKAEVDTKLNVLTSPTINGNTSAAGNISPSVTNTYDLGTTSLRWRNIYTQDLHLSNGIGDYTVVEGEEDLFLVNNKSGKSFKFALIEVDPSQVPPKSESN